MNHSNNLKKLWKDIKSAKHRLDVKIANWRTQSRESRKYSTTPYEEYICAEKAYKDAMIALQDYKELHDIK